MGKWEFFGKMPSLVPSSFMSGPVGGGVAEVGKSWIIYPPDRS